MRDHSATAKALLAEIGLTDGGELFTLSQGPAEEPATEAAQRLAQHAWMAINRIDDAERHADQYLRTMTEHVTQQQANAAAGYQRDATWMQQAATRYAEQVATIQAACDKFRAAALPLAIILGLDH